MCFVFRWCRLSLEFNRQKMKRARKYYMLYAKWGKRLAPVDTIYGDEYGKGSLQKILY